MGSCQPKLTQLQRDILEAFFAGETQFALTGGTALGGFHLGHRQSQDLDLFARPPATLESAERALQAAASDCAAELVTEQRFPEFRRFRAARGDDATIIDLAIDRAPAVDPSPVRFGSIRVHSLREIAANKICTLLSRSEIRDLVDLKALLEAGTDLEQALTDAEHKDGGVNPATLAWLLSELSIAPDAPIPGDLPASELDSFREALVRRLRTLAFPERNRR